MMTHTRSIEPFGAPEHALLVDLTQQDSLPSSDLTGPVAFYENDIAIFLGLAPYNGGLIPCKVLRDFMPTPVRFGDNRTELVMDRNQPFYICPIDGSKMEWVPAAYGEPPAGRRLVQAGFDENGRPWYHAVALINGVKVAGKVGPLGGASVPLNGKEEIREHYQVLCWRR